MKQKFRDISLSKDNKERLTQINSIIAEYQEQDLVLTLRQLYYQLVSRDLIPNKQVEYSKISKILKEGRMAGIVDWAAIEDRLRKPYKPGSWDDPKDIIESCIHQFQLPRMRGQSIYIEVWVEKDALSGVLSRVTKKYHIPILVNRGYSSASAMYDSFIRFRDNGYYEDKPIRVLYLGDYDPSGLDMIRDITNRINEFSGGAGFDDFEFNFKIVPIALTKKQIEEHNPPPNPAKLTDPRSKNYTDKHGFQSWEVDALRPEILNDILEENIHSLIDLDLYNSVVEQEKKHIANLKQLKTKL